MVDGVECLSEVEVEKNRRVSFVLQTGYTFYLKDKEGNHTGSVKSIMFF